MRVSCTRHMAKWLWSHTSTNGSMLYRNPKSGMCFYSTGNMDVWIV